MMEQPSSNSARVTSPRLAASQGKWARLNSPDPALTRMRTRSPKVVMAAETVEATRRKLRAMLFRIDGAKTSLLVRFVSDE